MKFCTEKVTAILLGNTESNFLKKFLVENPVFLFFFVQLLCTSGNTQLIFPSCLTLKGLELGISQLKNVEAVKEEN